MILQKPTPFIYFVYIKKVNRSFPIAMQLSQVVFPQYIHFRISSCHFERYLKPNKSLIQMIAKFL